MLARRWWLTLLVAALSMSNAARWAATAQPETAGPAGAAEPGAAAKKESRSSKATHAEQDHGKLAGIMFDYDRKQNWLTVKVDGEAEPGKYLIDPADKKLAEELKSVFNASRVKLTFKQDGNARRLVSIARQVAKAQGTMTGEVVAVHNNFWVELQPKHGVADAFATGANYKDPQFMAELKGLQPGDVVTIKYNTDFERHRILSMHKIVSPPAKHAGKEPEPVGKKQE